MSRRYRSQTPGVCLVHPSVRDKSISDTGNACLARPGVRDRAVVRPCLYNCVWYFCTYPYGLSLNGWNSLFFIANNRHGVTIPTHTVKRHFPIWMTTARQPTTRRRSRVLPLKCTFICFYLWMRQRIHNTLIVADRYLRLMGDKTIPDSAEPRLESFHPPFVAGIDLPHQSVVDAYGL